MDKKAVQFSFTFIVFLIILLVLIAALLIWNFTGIRAFANSFGTAGNIINQTSGGAVSGLASP